ncbi:DEAD/DEAH box helicase [Apilactobacillus ozensis]|uniref:Superfamily II DNA RNA helicase n=1 Tax=Apilactobacillus ozensis DSM 23829 = JCM 17196 TaxID=1423781 RepID=A0A0R2ANS9_9LACO|nr:DEAD/DEAH box helicase [Apilactobacillus ozensis]KRM68319.1 superfamily II DNA RNA helicase [Apilactobacillus ozensis DSM 23829 = JCM 17196]MCK8607491.1 DEAD/DEAH box helicase [Apilactobacillus ozensis]
MNEHFKNYFEKLGFDKQTIIQSSVYEPLKKGDNVLGLSPTGSGKTLAFLMPTIETLIAGEGTQLMIIEPSQELAMQVTRIARSWAKLVDCKVLSLTGGANVKRQTDSLKKRPEVVIGTAGRIKSLISDKKLKTNHIKTVIVDEADDLLQGETLTTVRQIINACYSDVQLGFFSATKTEILEELTNWFGNKKIEKFDVRNIDDTRGEVKHGLLEVLRSNRNKMLVRLTHIKEFKALVFFNQMNDLNKAYSYFVHEHYNNIAKLTSDQNKIKRQKAMEDFRLGRVKLLLTTDVAARGIDIPKLPAVINYDLPDDAIDYIHRVGRTGRMGEKGVVLNFGDDHDLRDLKNLLKNEEYNLQPIYFFKNKLVDEVPKQPKVDKAIKKADKVTKSNASDDKKIRKNTNKKINKRSNVSQPNFSKKKKKNKHTKNKGMRKKWRNMNHK